MPTSEHPKIVTEYMTPDHHEVSKFIEVLIDWLNESQATLQSHNPKSTKVTPRFLKLIYTAPFLATIEDGMLGRWKKSSPKPLEEHAESGLAAKLEKKVLEMIEKELCNSLEEYPGEKNTRECHDHIIHEIIKGDQLANDQYKKYLLDMYAIYRVLEQGLRNNKDNPAIKEIFMPNELNRTEPLREDIEFYFLDDILTNPKMSDSAKEYIDKIYIIATKKPHLLVSHAYARSFGDFNASRVLKAAVSTALCLPCPDERVSGGLHFFHYEDIPSATVFKQTYAARLNMIEQEYHDEIVAEMEEAFKFSMNLFEELQVTKKVSVRRKPSFIPSKEQTNAIWWEDNGILIVFGVAVFLLSTLLAFLQW